MKGHEDVRVAAVTGAFTGIAILNKLGVIMQECRNESLILHGRAWLVLKMY
jgi:hypothetical protein